MTGYVSEVSEEETTSLYGNDAIEKLKGFLKSGAELFVPKEARKSCLVALGVAGTLFSAVAIHNYVERDTTSHIAQKPEVKPAFPFQIHMEAPPEVTIPLPDLIPKNPETVIHEDKINLNDAPDIPKPVHEAIQKASTKTGFKADILGAMAYMESRFDNHAHAHKHISSATGLFQFTNSSWLYSLMKHGDEIGLSSVSSNIYQTKTGRMALHRPKDEKYIMGLRKNSTISSILTAKVAQENQKMIEEIKGSQATPGDIYLTHVVGPNGMMKIHSALKTHPNISMASVLGEDVVRNNKNLFINENGHTKTVREAYAGVKELMSNAINYYRYAEREYAKSVPHTNEKVANLGSKGPSPI